MLQEIQATVIHPDGSKTQGWWPIGTLSEGGYDFQIPAEGGDAYREFHRIFEFKIEETLPDPKRGEDYRILPREVEESEGILAPTYHAIPPGGIQ